MSIKLNIDNDVRNKVEEAVNEINKFIRLGKENLYNESAIEIIDKFGLNNLLFIGCKLHKLPNTKYLELPQKEISEDRLESILFSLENLMQNS